MSIYLDTVTKWITTTPLRNAIAIDETGTKLIEVDHETGAPTGVELYIGKIAEQDKEYVKSPLILKAGNYYRDQDGAVYVLSDITVEEVLYNHGIRFYGDYDNYYTPEGHCYGWNARRKEGEDLMTEVTKREFGIFIRSSHG